MTDRHHITDKFLSMAKDSKQSMIIKNGLKKIGRKNYQNNLGIIIRYVQLQQFVFQIF
jgi:hypothetical protein